MKLKLLEAPERKEVYIKVQLKNNKQPLNEWYPYLDQTKVAPFRS